MKYLISITAALIISFSLYAETTSEIFVYTREGCGRCEFTINYLKSHNITYTEYPIADVTNYNRLCEIISKSGKTNNGFIRTPVIIKNGIVNFNIDNLEEFVKNL